MANMKICFECSRCLEEYEKELKRDAKNVINIRSDIINEMREAGWHVGATTLCPECNASLKDRCKDCEGFENKSMCSTRCVKHDIVVSEMDVCADWEKVRTALVKDGGHRQYE